MKNPLHDKPDESSPGPFDDYASPGPGDLSCKREVHLRGLQTALRVLSAVAFGLAVSSACVVVTLDFFHFFGTDLLPWRLKSAFPLIFVGVSYACLQFILPRSLKEFILSLAVGVAFILWGVEQFVPNPAIASLIDDAVMLLFVLDLSIVIRGNLSRLGPE